jgi:hypothetical protein
MRTGGSSAKGAEFERLVCKTFSRWMTEGKRDDLFWRTSLSGGRATIAKKGGRMNKSQMGDICSVDPEGDWLIKKFVLECKYYKSLDIQGGLLKGSGVLIEFWRKLCHDCKDSGREPLLIAKQNNYPIILITTEQGTSSFGFGLKHPDYALSAKHTHHLATLHHFARRAEVYLFDCLEKVVSPTHRLRGHDD